MSSFFKGAGEALKSVKLLNDELIRLREQCIHLKDQCVRLENAAAAASQAHRMEVDDLRKRLATLEARFTATVEQSIVGAAKDAVRDHVATTGQLPPVTVVGRPASRRKKNSTLSVGPEPA